MADLVASGRFAMHEVDVRKTEVKQTKISIGPDSDIYPAYQGGREIEADRWVQPVADPLTRAPVANSTRPQAIAATEGSIVSLGHLDVAAAADLTAQGGIARLVTRVARSLRRAEANVMVTILGPDHLALQIQQESGVLDLIHASKAGVLGLERLETRHAIAPGGRQTELSGPPQRAGLGVEAALEFLGVNPTRSLVSAIFAEYGWVNVSGLGRVSFLIVADAPPSSKPRWVVVFVWMNGGHERATLEALFHDLSESLGLLHYGKLGALDKGRLALSASPARGVANAVH